MKISRKLILHQNALLHALFLKVFTQSLREDSRISFRMNYPFWVVDLENYEPGDESTELVKSLLDLTDDVKLKERVNKEGVFAYILIKDLQPNIFQQVEASIIAFLLHGW